MFCRKSWKSLIFSYSFVMAGEGAAGKRDKCVRVNPDYKASRRKVVLAAKAKGILRCPRCSAIRSGNKSTHKPHDRTAPDCVMRAKLQWASPAMKTVLAPGSQPKISSLATPPDVAGEYKGFKPTQQQINDFLLQKYQSISSTYLNLPKVSDMPREKSSWSASAARSLLKIDSPQSVEGTSSVQVILSPFELTLLCEQPRVHNTSCCLHDISVFYRPYSTLSTFRHYVLHLTFSLRNSRCRSQAF